MFSLRPLALALLAASAIADPLPRWKFDVTPNPRFLLLTPTHREALHMLEYGVRARKGIILLGVFMFIGAGGMFLPLVTLINSISGGG